MEPLKALREYLGQLTPGKLQDNVGLSSLLADCWDDLENSDMGGMESYKLGGRMEDIRWEPPILSFTIERHGAAVLGSVYAELQRWSINVNNGKVDCDLSGRRLIGEREPPLKVAPLVEQVIQLVVQHKEDERLNWKNETRVTVRVGNIIPSGSAVAQTMAGRRKRFAKLLEKEMHSIGWTPVEGTTAHTYELSN